MKKGIFKFYLNITQPFFTLVLDFLLHIRNTRLYKTKSESYSFLITLSPLYFQSHFPVCGVLT